MKKNKPAKLLILTVILTIAAAASALTSSCSILRSADIDPISPATKADEQQIEVAGKPDDDGAADEPETDIPAIETPELAIPTVEIPKIEIPTIGIPEINTPPDLPDLTVQLGFEVYENAALGIKIQYPIDWMYIDPSISPEEFSAMIEEVMGSEAAGLFENFDIDPSAITVMWFDFKNATELFVPNTNMVVSDAGGVTQNDLKSPYNLKDLQDMYEGYYSQMFGGFNSIGDMYGKEMGGNYFAVYKFNYSIDAGYYTVSASCYQAMTVKNNVLYVVTFTTHGGQLDEATYETMLSSLEF